jgi:hypothetical protein
MCPGVGGCWGASGRLLMHVHDSSAFRSTCGQLQHCATACYGWCKGGCQERPRSHCTDARSWRRLLRGWELLRSGADPTLRDRDGSTLVSIAQRKGTWAALHTLWNAVPAPDDGRRPCTPPLQRASEIWVSRSDERAPVKRQEEEDPLDDMLFAHVDVLLMP